MFHLLGLSWGCLGALLGCLGRLTVLRPSWAVLGPSWGPLGTSWGALGGPWSRLGASEARKGDNMKNIEKHTEYQCFCLLGLSWGSSWSALGASPGLLRPSWRHLGPSWRLWWPPRSVLEAILGVLDALESARDVSGRRQSLGKRGRFTHLDARWEGGGP